jgi:membrane protein YdbS with pleckstrin-like domain
MPQTLQQRDVKQSIIMFVLLITIPVGIYKWHKYQVQANNFLVEQGICYYNKHGNMLCPNS